MQGLDFLLSVYWKDGEGFSATNLSILEHAAICLKVLKGLWMAAGDWNLEPHLAVANWLTMVVGLLTRLAKPHAMGMRMTFSSCKRQFRRLLLAGRGLSMGGSSHVSPPD